MNSKYKTILSLALFAFFIIGSYFAYSFLSKQYNPLSNLQGKKDITKIEEQESNDKELEREKIKAPDFIVYDAQGNEAKLSDFIGKPVVINFWTTWCSFCLKEMPDFEESYKANGEAVEFLMIDCVDGIRETKEKGESFIIENDFTFPVYYDTDGNAAEAYQIDSLPTSIFIDKEGYLIAYNPGMLTKEMLQKGIELIAPIN